MPEGQEEWSFLYVQQLQEALCPVLNLLVQETTISWSESGRVSLRWLGAGPHGVWGETEDLFGLGKTRQRMDLIIIFHYLMGVYREDEVRLFSGVYSKRQQATVALFGREIAIWILKKYFHNNSGLARGQAAQRGSGEVLGDFQNLTGQCPKQPDPTLMSAPLWEGDGTSWPPDTPSNLNYFVIHYQFFKFSLNSTETSSMENKLFLSNFNHLKNRLGNLKNVKLSRNVIYRTWCLLLVKSVIARNHYTGWCCCHFDRWSKDERNKLLPYSQFV